ncbi:MAG: riboflavin biosynthesis protein RibF [Opitutaceae bacterium]
MDYPLCVQSFEAVADLTDELHLAIGVFDGVHVGHKAVIESAVLSARGSDGVSGVLTFDPHPSRLFRPDDATRLIMDVPSKVAMLQDVGVNVVICKKFDREFASIPADEFLAHLKQQLPSLRSIYVGQNFRFGQKRLGDVGTLVETGKQLGLDVFSVERIQHNGEPISSTRIRKELEAGSIESVNHLFGYNYTSVGKIIGGAKLGRQIGFPTLNLPWNPESRPRYGVYLVRFRERGCTVWQSGVANYGIKPTVADADQTPALEVHGLEGSSVGEGDVVEVEWLRFIRPEQKFDSIDALKVQIAQDCETARAFAKH